MGCVRLAFSSNGVRPLSSLAAGARGTVDSVRANVEQRLHRLIGLGVTPGAAVVVLQTMPGIVFLCDHTEIAVERTVADAILVAPPED